MIDLAFALVLATAPTCNPPAGEMSGCQVIECPPSTDLVYSADGIPSCLPWADQPTDDESAPDRPDFTEVCTIACPPHIDIPAPPPASQAPIVDVAPPDFTAIIRAILELLFR